NEFYCKADGSLSLCGRFRNRQKDVCNLAAECVIIGKIKEPGRERTFLKRSVYTVSIHSGECIHGLLLTSRLLENRCRRKHSGAGLWIVGLRVCRKKISETGAIWSGNLPVGQGLGFANTAEKL